MKNIRIVPLTEEELERIQVTFADRMLELNQRAIDGKSTPIDVSTELESLRKVVQKFHNYHPSKTRTAIA